MAGIGSGYDLSVGTFSPDGRVFQTEYAQKAVDNGGTVVGIRCTDGVVLGVENPFVSKMIEPGSASCAYAAARHAGLAVGGVAADGRAVAGRAQAEAVAYKNLYGSPIPGHVLAERLASFVHAFNLYWYVRPFGSTALLATYDVDAEAEEGAAMADAAVGGGAGPRPGGGGGGGGAGAGPALYAIDPSGAAHRYRGTAVGKGRQAAKTAIERLDLQSLTCAEGVVAVAKILHSVHEGDKPFELELAWVCDASGRKFERVPAEVAAAAEAAAKAALADSDIED